MAVSVVRHPQFLLHSAGFMHPESPARLRAIDDALSCSKLSLCEIAARAATRAEIASAHTSDYVERILRSRGRPTLFDADTRTNEHSVDAALFAAGGTIDLALSVAAGRVPPGIALVRPPGHHATPDTAMGFCIFNHVAIAARQLIERTDVRRVLIYDFDVHHGNGTEAIFWRDPNVLYVSTHQTPLYPGTGAKDDIGEGDGLGMTLNIPLLAGDGDAELLGAVTEMVVPRARSFAPDFILLSAGFDAYVKDPIGGLSVTMDGYFRLGCALRNLAEELCAGRICSVLEGGYDLAGLGDCVVAFLRGLDG